MECLVALHEEVEYLSLWLRVAPVSAPISLGHSTLISTLILVNQTKLVVPKL